jgi:four helix bundle protein
MIAISHTIVIHSHTLAMHISGHENLRVYQAANEIGQVVWDIVTRWGYFEKDTIGKQWVRSADSIAANIAEGYGRFHYKENKNFAYYSRGSVAETQTWLVKSYNRKLVSADEFEMLNSKLRDLSIRLNNYLKTIGPIHD